jgi:hypothetical protein
LAGLGASVVGEGIAALFGYAGTSGRPPEDDLDAVDAVAGNGSSDGSDMVEVAPYTYAHVPAPPPEPPETIVIDGSPADGEVEMSANERWLLTITPLVALVVFLTATALPLKILPKWYPIKTNDSSFVTGWATWNYQGYERKAAYPEYHDVITTMDRVGKEHGCGRSSWEYEPELDRFGTPMALMLLPYWTHGCIGSMEGLYFESSATTPYHFLSNSELSLRPPRPQRDLPYRELDLKTGVQHLQLLGVRYYMALSDQAQAQARVHPDLTLVATTGKWTATVTEAGKTAEAKTRSWEVYEVKDSAIVSPLKFEPVVMTDVPKGGSQWQDAGVEFFQRDAAQWAVPLAASGPKGWARVTGPASTAPMKPVTPARITNLETSEDGISFNVDKVGVPVLVKTSYFPNWRASGAKGPWRVTPNQMVVIPTSKHVSLDYRNTPVDLFAWAMTYLAAIGLIVLAVRERRARRAAADQGEQETLAMASDWPTSEPLAPQLEPEPPQPVH